MEMDALAYAYVVMKKYKYGKVRYLYVYRVNRNDEFYKIADE